MHTSKQEVDMRQNMLRASMTERIFPEIDGMLRDPEFHRCALYIKKRSGSPEYRSTTDLVLCELSPNFKAKCRKYYRGLGKELLDDITDQERAELVFTMKSGLVFALMAMRDDDKKSWRGIRKKIDERLALIKKSN